MQSGLCYLSAGLKLTKLLRLEILPPIHEKTAAWKIIYVSCPSVWENGLDLLIQSRPPYTTINLLIVSPTLTYYTGWYLIPGKKRASPSFYRPNLKARQTKKISRSFGLAYRKPTTTRSTKSTTEVIKSTLDIQNFLFSSNVSKNMYSTRIPPPLALAMSHGYKNNPGLEQPG